MFDTDYLQMTSFHMVLSLPRGDQNFHGLKYRSARVTYDETFRDKRSITLEVKLDGGFSFYFSDIEEDLFMLLNQITYHAKEWVIEYFDAEFTWGSIEEGLVKTTSLNEVERLLTEKAIFGFEEYKAAQEP